MSKVRLTTANYVDPDLVSIAYVSSEQAAFPASNLYNAQRRSKVWRSDGHWEITAANQTIIFRENAGVDLTAEVAIGHYASTTLFLAAVKNALDSAGASTYTCAVDTTTLKIKLTSGGGGGRIFQLQWADALSLGFATATGFDTSENDTGALTYTADALRLHTDEWAKWDFGISTNPKAFIAIGLRNSPIKISPSATILLQGSHTDAWGSPGYSVAIAYDEEVLSEIDPDGLHTESLRYWRAKIVDPDNANGYVELGSIFLGDFYEPTIGSAVFPFQGAKIDPSTTSISEGGQTYSDRRQKAERFQVAWEHLTLTEKEAIDAIWDSFGTSVPFFIIADPDSAFGSVASKYIRYVKFEAEPSWSLETPNNFSYSMNLREQL